MHDILAQQIKTQVSRLGVKELLTPGRPMSQDALERVPDPGRRDTPRNG